jgi:hypothetical protein
MARQDATGSQKRQQNPLALPQPGDLTLLRHPPGRIARQLACGAVAGPLSSARF